jgi:hypothetical protein
MTKRCAIVLPVVLALAACGGGGGGSNSVLPADRVKIETPAPSASPGEHTATPSPVPTGAGATPLPTAMPSTTPTTSSTVALGGYTGSSTTYKPHNSGDTYEYSEDVALTFSQATQNNFSYTITGSDGSTPPSSVYWFNYGKTASITVRKVPGLVYTIRVTQPVAYTATFTTAPNPTAPAPLRSTLGEPYRYGTLEHPFPFSLGNMTCSGPGGYGGTCTLAASSLQQIQFLCNAHVRYVRIDYPASQILDKNTAFFAQPDFSKEDAIMDQLAQCGITEMPIILQYSAGAVMTGNQSNSFPMQFASSTDPANVNHIPGYADFAADVVQHIAAKYPQITRVELFNEANNAGWGNFPVSGNYAQIDRSGAEASVYMKAAYAAIKAIDPRMTVVGPALADGGTTTDPRKFLPTMLQNGCGPGTCYDVLSVHNYDWENPTVVKAQSYMNRWNIYQTLQQQLAQSGYSGVHVMLTEWGYSTVMSPVGFDPQVQARYLALGLNLMLADPTVDGVTYVNMYNQATDFWGNTALLDQSFGTKPAFNLFSQFAAF